VKAWLLAMSERRWLQVAGCVCAAAVLAAVLFHQSEQPGDLSQMAGAFTALLAGHIGSIYPRGTTMTSPPGFVLLAAPVIFLLGGSSTAHTTQVVVAVLSGCFLAVAALRLVRRQLPGSRGPSNLVVTVAVMLGAPTLGALYGSYHPEDVVATAFVLLALADTGYGHDRRVGLALGAALLTRQWAVLVVAPVLLASGPGWRRVGGTAGAACLVVLAPFGALSAGGLLRALTAPAVGMSSYSFWSQVGLPESLAYTTARLAPLVCCVPTAFLLRRRWLRVPPRSVQVVAATAVFVGYRTVLDTAAEPYYVLPLFVLLAITAVCDPDRARRAWTLLAVLGLEAMLLAEPHYLGGPGPPGLLAFGLLAAELGGLACGWRMASDGGARARRPDRAGVR
jgi:hypothetical protein